MTQKNHTPLDKNFTKSSFSPSKETEPIPKPAENIVIKEVVEKKVHEEVKPHVQIRAESIKLPESLKQVGIKANKTSTFSDYKNVIIPLADDKVLQGLHAPITSSIRWLATFAFYLLRKAHLTLKIVHGKTVRVIQR